MLGLNLDLSDLDKEVGNLQDKLASVARKNVQFAAYIKQLEKDFAEVKYEEPLEISPDEAVRLAEEFLKEKRDD